MEKNTTHQFSVARRAAILLSVALLTACASGVKLDDVDGKGGSVDYSSQPWNDPKSPLFKRSIYFDFDSYSVKPQYQATLQAHANYLKANKDRKIRIEGNTDERGTTEYNLALGQRRSDAVRKSLNLLGVSDSQIEAVSFGKEKPKAEGSNEAAWQENRRADIAY
ncbi:MAG: peptidoglycan-associated lipoprotein Pal [Polynucleobacter sp.]|nr:MAG: peptidoglycan-associated lipoprotein Pal [Polynucleobacter sp.]